jgi:hypothetical protein
MLKPQLSAIIAFPINQSYICSECDVVMNQVQCPYCLTSNSAPLSTWLNRETEYVDNRPIEMEIGPIEKENLNAKETSNSM